MASRVRHCPACDHHALSEAARRGVGTTRVSHPRVQAVTRPSSRAGPQKRQTRRRGTGGCCAPRDENAEWFVKNWLGEAHGSAGEQAPCSRSAAVLHAGRHGAHACAPARRRASQRSAATPAGASPANDRNKEFRRAHGGHVPCISPVISVCTSSGVRMLAAPAKAVTIGAAAVPFRAAACCDRRQHLSLSSDNAGGAARMRASQCKPRTFGEAGEHDGHHRCESLCGRVACCDACQRAQSAAFSSCRRHHACSSCSWPSSQASGAHILCGYVCARF